MKKGFLSIIFTVCYHAIFSQVSFFQKDTISFFLYATDTNEKFGCHLLEDPNPAFIYTCEPVCKYMFIHINKRGDVFWYDKPFKNNEVNINGEILFRDHHTDPYPLFRTSVNNKRIIYKSLKKPYRQTVQYSLNFNDTISQNDLSELFYSNPTKHPKGYSYKKVYYVKDSTIVIDGAIIDCYLFKGFYDPLDNFGRNISFFTELVEKKSLVPIYTLDNKYEYNIEDDTRRYYKLIRSFTIIPKNLAD